MFTAFRNRVLVTAANGWVHQAIMATVDEPLASDCSAAYIITLKQELKEGKLKPALSRYRAAHLEIPEVGLSLLDGVVTTLRQLTMHRPHSLEVERVIDGLVSTIDATMRNSPGRILPRNGDFARAADKTGLSDFFR